MNPQYPQGKQSISSVSTWLVTDQIFIPTVYPGPPGKPLTSLPSTWLIPDWPFPALVNPHYHEGKQTIYLASTCSITDQLFIPTVCPGPPGKLLTSLPSTWLISDWPFPAPVNPHYHEGKQKNYLASTCSITDQLFIPTVRPGPPGKPLNSLPSTWLIPDWPFPALVSPHYHEGKQTIYLASTCLITDQLFIPTVYPGPPGKPLTSLPSTWLISDWPFPAPVNPHYHEGKQTIYLASTCSITDQVFIPTVHPGPPGKPLTSLPSTWLIPDWPFPAPVNPHYPQGKQTISLASTCLIADHLFIPTVHPGPQCKPLISLPSTLTDW